MALNAIARLLFVSAIAAVRDLFAPRNLYFSGNMFAFADELLDVAKGDSIKLLNCKFC